MLRRLRDFEKWDVRSIDGRDLGTIEDFYFDDEMWTVRYLVVKTGNWLTGRSVLLSPMSVARIELSEARFEMGLAEDQIRSAPDADLTRPVSRQWESTFSGYYGIPYYWGGPRVWGLDATPMEARASAAPPRPSPEPTPEEQHLRSAHEVAGYHIHATDGEIGHVEDYLVEENTWTIRYLLVDTSNWIGGRTVLIAPEWAERIDWAHQQVRVEVPREVVKNSPAYDPRTGVDRAYEARLAEFYRRPVRRT